MWEFKPIFEDRELDDRSKFANQVCKTLIEKNGGVYGKSMPEVEIYYKYFKEHVRNVYQFIDCEIPLFALYELSRNPEIVKADFGLDKEEFKIALNNTYRACDKLFLEDINEE